MIPISFLTAVFAAALAAPGQCLSPAGVNSLDASIAATATVPHGEAHVISMSVPQNYALASQSSIPTFTKSHPKPTQTLNCDSTTIGKTILTANGKGWMVNCDYDLKGNDFAQLRVNSWAECMEACSVAYMNVDPNECMAFAYVPLVTTMNCFLKTGGGPSSLEKAPGIRIGWRHGPELKTIDLTPLPTPPTKFTTDSSKYRLACYNCGDTTSRAQAMRAIDFFCAGGPPGNQTFGGFYPDRLLMGNDSISLEYENSWESFTRRGYASYLIVTVKDGCMIDFASLDDGACHGLFAQGLIDRCDTSGTEYKKGGFLDDACTRWTMDINPIMFNDRYGWDGCLGGEDTDCYKWHKGIYDGPEDDIKVCGPPPS